MAISYVQSASGAGGGNVVNASAQFSTAQATVGNNVFVAIFAKNATGITPIVSQVTDNASTANTYTALTSFALYATGGGTYYYIAWYVGTVVHIPTPSTTKLKATATVTVNQGTLAAGITEVSGYKSADSGAQIVSSSSSASSISLTPNINNSSELLLCAVYPANALAAGTGWNLPSATGSANQTIMHSNITSGTGSTSETVATQTSGFYLASMIGLTSNVRFPATIADVTSTAFNLEVACRFPASISDASSVAYHLEVARRFPSLVSDSSTTAANLEVNRRFPSAIVDASSTGANLEVNRRFYFSPQTGFANTTTIPSIQLVQIASTSPTTTGSVSVSFPNTSTIGDLVVITTFWDSNATLGNGSLFDNAGNSYTLVGTTSTAAPIHNVAVYQGVITTLPSGNLGSTVIYGPSAWSSTTSYLIGDQVQGTDNNYYQATAANTNQAPPNASYWNLLSSPPPESSGNASIVVSEYNGQATGAVLIDPLSLIVDQEPAWISNEVLTLSYSGCAIYAAVYNNGNANISVSPGYNQRFLNTVGQAVVDSLSYPTPGGPQSVSPFISSPVTTTKTATIIFGILSNNSQLISAPVPTSINRNKRPSTGIYQEGGVDANPTGLLCWTNPVLYGLSYRASWANIEPSPGVYNWTELDYAISLAAQYNKYVALAVVASIHSPSWLLGQGCSQYTYYSADNSVLVLSFAPWDPIFLSYLSAMVTAMGQRYDSNPLVSFIVVGTGLDDGEAFVTKGTSGLPGLGCGIWAGGSYVPGNQVYNPTDQNYYQCTTSHTNQQPPNATYWSPITASQITGVATWINSTNETIGYYLTAFPTTPVIMITGNAVPNDTTSMASIIATNAPNPLFGFKSDGLDVGQTPNPFFGQYTATNPVGFQENLPTHSYTKTATLMANGYLAGGRLYEIYSADANDSLGTNTWEMYAYGLYGQNANVVSYSLVNFNLEVDRRFPATITDSTSTGANLEVARSFPQTINDSTETSVTLEVTRSFPQTISDNTEVSGNLEVTVSFPSAITDNTEVSGYITITVAFPSTIVSQTQVSDSLEVKRSFPATIEDTTSVAGSFLVSVYHRFPSSIGDTTSVSGNLEVERSFQVIANDSSAVSGGYTVHIRYPASIEDTTDTTANLEVGRSFVCTIVDSTEVGGNFEVGRQFACTVTDSTLVAGNISNVPIATLLAGAILSVLRIDPTATITRSDPVANVSNG